MNEADRAALLASAGRLGTSPLDLATVISYETGGTFDPGIRGGAGNRHVGLIQFGPAEQRQYGASQDQSFAEQLPAVEAYLTDRGFRPGMGRLDLYSTINAGRPGRYGASDADNGGAPGTVADKVRDQMGAHEAKASAFLGGDFFPKLPGTSPAHGAFGIGGPTQGRAPFALAPAGGAAMTVPDASKADDGPDLKRILAALGTASGAGPGQTAAQAAVATPPRSKLVPPGPGFDASRFFSLLPSARR